MLTGLLAAGTSVTQAESGLLDAALEPWNSAASFAGIVAFLLVLRLLTLDVRRCYRLFRAFHARTLRGSRTQAWLAIGWIAFTDNTLFARDSRTMLRRLRVQLEQEIFFERPMFAWPDEDVTIPAGATWWDRRRLRAAALARHRATLREWRAKI